MDISTEEDDDGWINKAFGVPSVPESCRDHYPFSKCTALFYRSKLTFILLHIAYAFYQADEPCIRLALLLNCWLLFIMCERVYKNYPWREPLKVWLWRIRLALPWSELFSTACAVLLLLVCISLGIGCKLRQPLVAAPVWWFCCMLAWPLVRDRWHREERSEVDYEQFSAIRPRILTLPRPLALLLATLQSPSLLALLAASAASWVVGLFLPGLVAVVWMVSTTALALACLAVFCCDRLPNDIGRTFAAWDAEEEAYVRKIESNLRMVRSQLRIGQPREDGIGFDRLAVQVPLLQREADLLLKASRTLKEFKEQELENLTTSREVMEFRERLDHYGPYTSQCCVS